MSQNLTGPWDSAFYVELPSKLRSKSNYRHGQKGWGALATFEAVAGGTFAQARPEDWDLGAKNKPLKSRPVVVIAIAATSLLDSTNFTKSVADAMQGVLVHNDASVAGSSTICERAKDNQRCGVAVAQLPAGAGLREQSEALRALLDQLPDLYEE